MIRVKFGFVINASILISMMFLVGCKGDHNQSSENSNTKADSVKSKASAVQSRDSNLNVSRSNARNYSLRFDKEVSCDSLLTLLVQSSSLERIEKEGYQVQVDDVVNGILKIKVTNRNEIGVDVPLVWLDLDLKKKALTNVTFGEENPKYLTYDTTILYRINRHCKLIQ